MADTFISYARGDQAIAARVAKGLQAAGFDVWWDADLPAHRAYSEIIEHKLEEAKAVIVLWSKTAAKSQWVRAEADFARNAGKLVQCTIDKTIPPLPFNQIQCADLKGWRGAAGNPGWTKLKSSALALVSGEEKNAEPPSRHSLTDRILEHRWSLAAGLSVLLAAFALLLFFVRPGEEAKPVLAVLPFRALDAQDTSLVAGMWEDTRQAIGRNPQLVVLGPNTAQELADKGEQTARKAADYLLEASVRTAGDRIRISTQLLRTKDGEQVWSQDFDRKLDDVFALQSQIASEIEGRIRGRLAEKGGTMPEHIATSGEVYALYSDARSKIRKRDFGKSVPAAHQQLLQVVKLDPNFAPGWAALSEADQMLVPSQRNWVTTNNSEQYARKALDLAPNLASAHAALALALGLKGPVARAAVERSVELDPNDFEALTWLGNMRGDGGDKKGAIEAYRRAAEIEPLFWPAVMNMYSALKAEGDQAGIQALLDKENRMGAGYLGVSIMVQDAYSKGNLAQALNTGLATLKNEKIGGPPTVSGGIWTILIQLGFIDEAAKMGGPDFAPYLWRNDPRGLDMIAQHKIDARTLFSLDPLTENAARVYLLTGRGNELAQKYLSLKLTPEGFRNLSDDPDHFIFSAPLVALALKQNGNTGDARALLLLAETEAKQKDIQKPLYAVLLARVYAAQGRNGEAIPLIVGAVNRGWIPEPPALQVDLHNDLALEGLKGDARFEHARDQIMGTIARERAQVDLRLIRQLDSA